MPRPALLPILDENLDEFAGFLSEKFGAGTAEEWRAVFEHDWCADKPNNGFMLREGERIVGAIGAIYASRPVRGSIERFCNITSWYVLPEFRSQSMRLATALSSQPGYHFTDFTPTKVVTDVLKFLKFRAIDARQILLPNLPGIGHAWTRTKIIDDPAKMQAALNDDQAKIVRDHLNFPWLRQAVLIDPRGPIHIVYKPVPFKRMPSAFLLAVNDREGFSRNRKRFGSHLLFKHGILFMRLERRFLTHVPASAITLKRFPRKLYRSTTLRDDDFDNLYSEVAAINLPGNLI